MPLPLIAGLLARLGLSGGARVAARSSARAVAQRAAAGAAAKQAATSAAGQAAKGGFFGAAKQGIAEATAYGLMQRLLGLIDKSTPSFVHHIVVKVSAGPAGDLRAAYYLACAAAFGRFGRGVTRTTGSYFEMSCQTNVMEKDVTVTIGYHTALMGQVNRAVTGGRDEYDVIFDGPDQLTVGAGWNSSFFGSKSSGLNYPQGTTYKIRGGIAVPVAPIPGGVRLPPVGLLAQDPLLLGNDYNPDQLLPFRWLVPQADARRTDPTLIAFLQPFRGRALPASLPSVYREAQCRVSTGLVFFLRNHSPISQDAYTRVFTTPAGRIPVLPDDGRIITTGETDNPLVQPPRPPVDGISRGDLIRMTIAALSDPGILPPLPDLTETPINTSGAYAWVPGSVKQGDQQNTILDLTTPSIPAPNASLATGIGLGAVQGVTELLDQVPLMKD